MNTRVFLIKYKNGSEQYQQSDAVDAADQINRTFGLTLEQATEFGVSVEMMPEDFQMPGTEEVKPEEVKVEETQTNLELVPEGTPSAVAQVEGHAPTISQTTDETQKAPWAQ
jgi:hypothetical protein